jgi:hypothetical protein
MVDLKFIQVITPVTHASFLQDLFNQVHHVPGIIGTVIAAIDQEDIELLAIVSEFFRLWQAGELPSGSSALGTFAGRCVPLGYETTNVANPGFNRFIAA